MTTETVVPEVDQIVCSIDGERFDGISFAHAFERAVSHHHHKLLPGSKVKVYTGHAVEYVPSDFLDGDLLDDLFEQMECRATDAAGEVADGFAYVTPEKKVELLKMLNDFVDENMSVGFYGVKGVEEHEITVTAKDLEDMK